MKIPLESSSLNDPLLLAQLAPRNSHGFASTFGSNLTFGSANKLS
jgi:hypothetical protein